MSAEMNDEEHVINTVNEVFHDFYGVSVRGRIKLAAFAVGEQVGVLRGLRIARSESQSSVQSATPSDSISIFSPLFMSSALLSDKKPSLDTDGTVVSIFGPIEKAVIALDAATDGARAIYNLTEHQAKKARKLAETRFWLFNIDDPNLK